MDSLCAKKIHKLLARWTCTGAAEAYKSTMALTAGRLREALWYDPNTGLFRWRIDRRKVRAGTIAGSLCNGYVRIGIDGRWYAAHRLAWLYVHGEWPSSEIDHRNTDRADNRLENLRPATRQQQSANASLRPDNACGFKGVFFHEPTKTWQASIRFNGKNRVLGNFSSPQEAHTAYTAAAVELFGEFARAS